MDKVGPRQTTRLEPRLQRTGRRPYTLEGKATMSYFSKTLNVPFERAVSRAIDELKKEGFGILTEIHVKATMKKKLDAEFRNYKILGACNYSLTGILSHHPQRRQVLTSSQTSGEIPVEERVGMRC